MKPLGAGISLAYLYILNYEVNYLSLSSIPQLPQLETRTCTTGVQTSYTGMCVYMYLAPDCGHGDVTSRLTHVRELSHPGVSGHIIRFQSSDAKPRIEVGAILPWLRGRVQTVVESSRDVDDAIPACRTKSGPA
jgi:hypothetical protein